MPREISAAQKADVSMSYSALKMALFPKYAFKAVQVEY
jgi:hypothetical protein